MAKVVLSVPKRVGRKLTLVTVTLADWAVMCDDPVIAAQVEDLKPECLGYLPFQELEWARECERWLTARVVSVEPPPTDGPDPGVCCGPPAQPKTKELQQAIQTGRVARRIT